jgi:hypothetical protein
VSDKVPNYLAQRVSSMIIEEGDTGVRLFFEASPGESDFSVTVTTHGIPQVIEAFSLGLSAIGNRSPEGVQHADVLDAVVRTQPGDPIIAMELAFGGRGKIFFRMTPKIAAELAGNLTVALEENKKTNIM